VSFSFAWDVSWTGTKAAGTPLTWLHGFLSQEGQPVRQRLTRLAQGGRDTLPPDGWGDNATDHRGIGIHVAKATQRRPDRPFEIVQVMGCTPEDERHGILSGDVGAVADARTDLLNGEIVGQIASQLQGVAYLARRDVACK